MRTATRITAKLDTGKVQIKIRYSSERSEFKRIERHKTYNRDTRDQHQMLDESCNQITPGKGTIISKLRHDSEAIYDSPGATISNLMILATD